MWKSFNRFRFLFIQMTSSRDFCISSFIASITNVHSKCIWNISHAISIVSKMSAYRCLSYNVSWSVWLMCKPIRSINSTSRLKICLQSKIRWVINELRLENERRRFVKCQPRKRHDTSQSYSRTLPQPPLLLLQVKRKRKNKRETMREHNSI